jgi:hypothetical protein
LKKTEGTKILALLLGLTVLFIGATNVLLPFPLFLVLGANTGLVWVAFGLVIMAIPYGMK